MSAVRSIISDSRIPRNFFNRIAAVIISLGNLVGLFVASPDDDDTPPAAPAMLALPAPRIAGLLPAPSPKALAAYRLQQIHERNIERRAYMRRRRVALRMEGRDLIGSRWAIALPASAGEIVKTGYREVTATISMQQRMIAETGVNDGNPNHAWQVLMDEYLAKQAAKQAAQVQVVEGEVAA